MKNYPALQIEFDPESWEVVQVCLITNTDVEATKLLELAKKMKKAVKESSEC